MKKKTRVALITGAAGLLGIQHAIALLEINFKVILLDIDRKNLIKQLIFKKKFSSKNVLSFKADITKEFEILSIKKIKQTKSLCRYPCQQCRY